MTNITLLQRIDLVEWVNAMGFSFYSVTRAKNTNPKSPVKEIRVPIMSHPDQTFSIDNLELTDQSVFVRVLSEHMGPLCAERIIKDTTFDETLKLYGYSRVDEQCNSLTNHWTNGKYIVSISVALHTWSLLNSKGVWEGSGSNNTHLAIELDRRKP